MPRSQSHQRVESLATIACSVPPGASGLGRALEGVVTYARSQGIEPETLYPLPAGQRAPDPETRDIRPVWRGGRFLLWTPLRYSYAWTTYAANVTFDAAVA